MRTLLLAGAAVLALGAQSAFAFPLIFPPSNSQTFHANLNGNHNHVLPGSGQVGPGYYEADVYGNGNNIKVNQYSHSDYYWHNGHWNKLSGQNEAYTLVIGSGNSDKLKQKSSAHCYSYSVFSCVYGSNVSLTGQFGWKNKTDVSQDAGRDGNNLSLIGQIGAKNSSTVSQTSTGSDLNLAGNLQIGYNNSSDISQNGEGNVALVGQFGANNSSNVSQHGDDNGAVVVQAGSGNSVNLNQSNNGAVSSISENGNGNSVSFFQASN